MLVFLDGLGASLGFLLAFGKFCFREVFGERREKKTQVKRQIKKASIMEEISSLLLMLEQLFMKNILNQ